MKKKKSILITKEQLMEALGDNGASQIKVDINPGENAETAINRTKAALSKNGVPTDGKNLEYVVPEEKLYSKKDILEARKSYLKENSITYTKEDFLKRK